MSFLQLILTNYSYVMSMILILLVRPQRSGGWDIHWKLPHGSNLACGAISICICICMCHVPSVIKQPVIIILQYFLWILLHCQISILMHQLWLWFHGNLLISSFIKYSISAHCLCSRNEAGGKVGKAWTLANMSCASFCTTTFCILTALSNEYFIASWLNFQFF